MEYQDICQVLVVFLNIAESVYQEHGVVCGIVSVAESMAFDDFVTQVFLGPVKVCRSYSR